MLYEVITNWRTGWCKHPSGYPGGVGYPNQRRTSRITSYNVCYTKLLRIVISASHNPYDDNGIKIFGRDGFKLPDAAEAEIEIPFPNRTLTFKQPLSITARERLALVGQSNDEG